MGRFFYGSFFNNIGYYVREERYSCIFVMGIEGIVIIYIILKVFLIVDFIFVLKYFILLYVGWFVMGEFYFVVMDNVRIYDNVGVRMIRERGGIVVFFLWVDLCNKNLIFKCG